MAKEGPTNSSYCYMIVYANVDQRGSITLTISIIVLCGTENMPHNIPPHSK